MSHGPKAARFCLWTFGALVARAPCADLPSPAQQKGQAACAGFAFYLGPAATAATHEVGDGDRFVISMRNESPTQGFQLGVRARKDGLTTRWEFSGDLGATRNQLVSLIVTVDGRSVGVEAPNQATSSQSAVLDIRRGSALQPFIEDDVLVFNLNPGLGGPGFIVAYIADAVRALNRIPPTGGAGCAVHELLVVDLGDTVTPGRQRPGDCNQDGRLNIADAICILQTLFSDVPVGGLPPGRFPCGDGASRPSQQLEPPEVRKWIGEGDDRGCYRDHQLLLPWRPSAAKRLELRGHSGLS